MNRDTSSRRLTVPQPSDGIENGNDQSATLLCQQHLWKMAFNQRALPAAARLLKGVTAEGGAENS
jgi:hypothetical protein